MAKATGNLLSIFGRWSRSLGLHYFALRYGLHNRGVKFLLSVTNKIRWKQIDLVVVVWPPAMTLLQDIRSDIASKYEVLNCESISIQPEHFREFICKLYAIDSASPIKIASKIERLQQPSCSLAFLTVRIPKPKMLVQDALNRVKCKNVGDLKDYIRRKYREALPDYIYDIIIHSTEVDYQNILVWELVLQYREVERR